jgi:hypothetical protein
MPKYEILITIHGWGHTVIEAVNEDAAREIFDNGDYEMSNEDVAFDFETIEEAE